MVECVIGCRKINWRYLTNAHIHWLKNIMVVKRKWENIIFFQTSVSESQWNKCKKLFPPCQLNSFFTSMNLYHGIMFNFTWLSQPVSLYLVTLIQIWITLNGVPKTDQLVRVVVCSVSGQSRNRNFREILRAA